MSLFRKLVILFGLLSLVILTSTLAIVYSESTNTIVKLSKQKAVSIIETIDSALESNIPDYQFEEVLLHLKQQDPNIMSFDIYKLNGSLYDIASTNPNNIGSKASPTSVVALTKNQTVTTLKGTTMEITAPILGYKRVVYSANVKFSIADDLKSTRTLLIRVLLVGLCALVLAVLAAWLFTREFLSKPVLAVVSAVNDVATGNLQTNLSSSERRRDEIGTLARSFQRMTTNLQQLMSRMAETADELNRDFEQLVRNGDYTSRGALHVSDVIMHVSNSAEQQAERLRQVRQSLSSILADMERKGNDRQGQIGLLSGNGQLLEIIQSWIASVESAVSSADEMNQSLKGIASTADGQLGAISQVNLTAARLSQMASDLRTLIATFET